MNVRKSVNLLSAALAAGFLAGFVPAVIEIVSNRYIQFRAYRLIALGLSTSLMQALIWVGSAVLFFAFSWILIRLAARTDPDRTTRRAAGLTGLGVILSVLVYGHFLLRSGDSFYARRLGYLQHGINRFLTGDVSLGRILRMNPVKIGIVAAGLAAVAAIFFLSVMAFRGIVRIDWSRLIGKLDRIGGFLRASAAVAILIAAAAGIAARPPFGKAAGPRPPNLVWVTIDALRADHLGCYGYEKNTSPFIDRLAAEGLLFRWAFSQESYTHASVPSFFTSTYPFQHRSLYDEPRIDRLDPRFLTVAEALKNAGYRTEAYVFNPHLYAKYGFDQGFDIYADHREGGLGGEPLYRKAETAMRIHRAVAKSLSASEYRPRFLYLHYRDVHSPYSPPPPFHKSFLPEGAEPRIDLLYRDPVPEDRAHVDLWVSQYDGEILYTDSSLEKTLALLEKQGIRRENTIFIISADHGEEFLDPRPGGPGIIGHTRTLYNELIHVPLIMSLPRSPGRKTIETAVELNDVFPTLVDVLDLEVAAGRQFQGRSLMPLIRGEEIPGRPVISGGRRDRGAIIEAGWKYIRQIPEREKGPGASFREELYDLRSDPGETVDLIAREKDRAAALRGALLKVQLRPAMVGRSRPVRLDKKTEEQLRSLGYLK